MSQATDRLGVVISAGGWHTPPLYANFMQALGERGIKSYAPLVPTLTVIHHDPTDNEHPVFNTAEPKTGWPSADDDAAAIEEDITALINQGRKVVVLAHSNGGFAATQATKPEFRIEERAKRNLPGGVIGILYVSAYLLPMGVSVNDLVGEATVPPFSKLHKYGKAGVSTPFRMREFFFARVSQEDSDRYSKLMRAQPVPRSKLTNDAYAHFPMGYVICTDDMALPREVQQAMCDAQVKEGHNIKLYSEPFDHSPTISAIERLVEIVLDFAHSAQHV